MTAATGEVDTRRSVVWTHQVMVDGAVTFRVGKDGAGLVAEWPGLAVLTCARDGSRQKFTRAARAPRRAIEKLRQGYVRALLRDLAGGLGLHASAVSLDGRGVLFVGASGAGKSTAAAQMCLSHGAQLLADDVALIACRRPDVLVLPSEGEHWLTDDSCRTIGFATRGAQSGGGKRRFRASSIASQGCRLALIVALRFDPSARGVTMRPVRGSEAARCLLGASIRFDLEDASARRREFEQVSTLYESAPFFEFVRGRNATCEFGAMALETLLARGNA